VKQDEFYDAIIQRIDTFSSQLLGSIPIVDEDVQKKELEARNLRAEADIVDSQLRLAHSRKQLEELKKV